MKIRNYTCKCGSDEFFISPFMTNGHIGIYCDRCGKWLKWADKNERNLLLKNQINNLTGDNHED